MGDTKSSAVTGRTSDGYHTFDELYEHRITLWIALCKRLVGSHRAYVWRSRLHSDGTGHPNWFVLGVGEAPGQQMTYHLPSYRWEDCSFAHTRPVAPTFDGHSPADVLERIKKL